ncbi:MAG: endolytic transglycosylase MltG [Erysipelotrichaceae bacterium]|nr:endolytic transglycosylase MltG [Erysipelotrichaceae bacterium]
MARRKIRVWTVIKIVLNLAIVLGMAGLAYGYYKYDQALKPLTPISHPVSFEVEENMTADDVVNKLYKENLITDKFMTKIYMRLKKKTNVYVGNFNLDANMSTKEIVSIITDESNAYRETVEVTLIDGYWAKEMAAAIAEQTDLTAGRIMSKWNDVEYVDKLIQEYPFLTEDIYKSEHCYLEGFLYPDTYQFYKNTTVEQVTEKLLDRQLEVYEKYAAQFKNSKLTPYEIYTLSSMTIFEGKTPEDMGLVAGVFYNRLDDGMLLGSSVTVCYALYDDYHTWQDCENNIDIDSDYNTYKHLGLPVGPICNGNEISLNAVLNPTSTDYMYFISDPSTGKMYFARTLEEHQRNIDTYLNY